MPRPNNLIASPSLTYTVRGSYALFTDPITKIGGEKCSYPIPTYQALQGITESVYWKPTIVWIVEAVRILHPIITTNKAMRTTFYNKSGNSLSYYTYLVNPAYQVKVHFEFNTDHPDLATDYLIEKHYAIAQRSLARGGRRDIFLGTRECQAYIAPSAWGDEPGAYDTSPAIVFGTMVHGITYPTAARPDGRIRLWTPWMEQGTIVFPRPDACSIIRTVPGLHVNPHTFSLDTITSADALFAHYLQEDV